MIVTRFAPSPTGRLHLGHAYSAVLADATARADGGRFLLRIEDLDPGRSRAEFVNGIFEDLDWLGLQPDAPALVQSRRARAYGEALERLRAQGLVYPCFCSRAKIAAALQAPHGSTGRYPGTCRGLPDDPDRRAAEPHGWRLNAEAAIALTGMPQWTEADGRCFTSKRDDFDDAIVARKDALAAYHLACVIDDAESGVTMVVRGADLRPSTPVQRLLQQILGLPAPCYLHHRLVAHEDGRRLAKRDLAPTLAAMRAAGVDGRTLAHDLRTGILPGDFRLIDP